MTPNGKQQTYTDQAVARVKGGDFQSFERRAVEKSWELSKTCPLTHPLHPVSLPFTLCVVGLYLNNVAKG